MIKCRNMKTCLPHQCEKTDRFQRDGLTAGIWAGDNKHPVILAENQVDWNNLLLVQKGMTAFLDVNIAILIENRFAAIVGTGQGSLSKNKVQTCQNRNVLFQHNSGFTCQFT